MSLATGKFSSTLSTWTSSSWLVFKVTHAVQVHISSLFGSETQNYQKHHKKWKKHNNPTETIMLNVVKHKMIIFILVEICVHICSSNPSAIQRSLRLWWLCTVCIRLSHIFTSGSSYWLGKCCYFEMIEGLFTKESIGVLPYSLKILIWQTSQVNVMVVAVWWKSLLKGLKNPLYHNYLMVMKLEILHFMIFFKTINFTWNLSW